MGSTAVSSATILALFVTGQEDLLPKMNAIISLTTISYLMWLSIHMFALSARHQGNSKSGRE